MTNCHFKSIVENYFLEKNMVRKIDEPINEQPVGGVGERIQPVEVYAVENLAVAAEAGKVLSGVPTSRQLRIEEEDQRLAKSLKQRKIEVLDYIRRGRLLDQVEIMPELIDFTPELLDSGIIDFEVVDYSKNDTISSLLKIFRDFEVVTVNNDRKIRDFFCEAGLKVKDQKHYLDEKWFSKYLVDVLKTLSVPKNPKNPQTDEQYMATQNKRVVDRLKSVFEEENLETFVIKYRENQRVLNVDFEQLPEHKVFPFLSEKRPSDGFYKFPRMSEYKGEVVSSVPDLSSQNLRPNLYMIARDTVPDFKGGVILDGNFGYDEDGNPIIPDDKMIIDHHDKFDNHTHDTATKMVFDLLEDSSKLAELESERLRDENGNLPIMTNNIDSDAIMSTWVLSNRTDPFVNDKLVRMIIRNIVWCGDFLLGTKVMEFGATARDYEYIVKNYLSATQDQIKELRIKKARDVLAEKELEAEEIKRQLEELNARAKASDPNILIKEQELSLLLTEGRTSGGRVLEKNEKGRAIGQIKKEINDLLSGVLDEVEVRDLTNLLNNANEKIQEKKKLLAEASNAPLSPEENLIALNHMHDVVKDIITNPFKYQKFLMEGRLKEKRTIDSTREQYRKGEIEIMPDEMDENILILRPLGLGYLPKPEVIDGLYFYFRGREDFNRELILTVNGNKYMMAINTQNMKGLQKHDFNLLIDELRQREGELIDLKIAELEQVIQGDGGSKKVRNELDLLKKDKERNSRGQLWRSRTQMVFCFRSYIPESELKEMIYVWKRVGGQRSDTSEKVAEVEQ